MKTKVTVEIDTFLYQKIKMLCVVEKITVKQIVEDFFIKKIKKNLLKNK